MLNIVVPIAGKSFFFDNDKDGFAKPFIEVCGKTMLELFISNYECISDKNFIFILKDEDVRRFHLDEAIYVLNPKAKIIIVKNETAGMPCSVMLAVDFIENENELLIVNMDQIFELNLSEYLAKLRGFDAGVLSIEAVHPRYAYVKTNALGEVLAAFEKKPISKNAIAGFYYFKRGIDFLEGAKSMLRKDTQIDGKFFIAPILNELILKNLKVKNLEIPNECYHSFYSPAKITEYERIKNANI